MSLRMTEHGFPVALGEVAGLSPTHGDWAVMAPLLRAIWRWVQVVIAEERLAEKKDERDRLKPLLDWCFREISRHTDPPCNHMSLADMAVAEAWMADLRRELGRKEG